MNKRPYPINTFSELWEAHNKQGLIVNTCCSHILEGLKMSLDTDQQELSKIVLDFDGFANERLSFINVTSGHYATINSERKMEFALRTNNVDK